MLRRFSSSSKKDQKRREEQRQASSAEAERKMWELQTKLDRLEKQKQEQEQARLREEEERREQMADSQHRDDSERKRQIGEVLDKTEVSSNRVEFNQGTMGLVDRMESHPAGKLFSGAVISNKPPPDRSLVLSRLRTYQAPNDIDRLVLSDVEPIDLKDQVVDISLAEAMTEQQYHNLKPYCLVSDVFVHYIPLDTFFTVSFPVNFFLNDYRTVEDTVVRYFPLSHSVGYNLLFTLDYCVRKEDLKLLTLAISSAINTFRPGVAWGTAKVVVSLVSLNFPIKTNMQKTMGVMHLADSDLQEYISDPRSSDGVLTPEGLKQLRAFYQRGDIENIVKAKDDTKEVNVAATVHNLVDPSTDVAQLMRSMRQQAEVKSSDPLKPPINPSRNTHHTEEATLNEEKKKGGILKWAEEVRPEDSPSQGGSEGGDTERRGKNASVEDDDAETIERPFSPPVPEPSPARQRFRHVNFGGLNEV